MNFAPSVYSHILSGIVLGASVIYLMLHGSNILTREPYRIGVLILLFSIALGIHGISHVVLEAVYGYNPLLLVTGKFGVPF